MGVSSPSSCDQVAAAAADRTVRIVVDLAAFDIRHALVEQRGQHADQARFGLPAQSQQDEIVARQNGVDDLRHHGVFVADDAREQRRRRAAACRSDYARSSSLTDRSPRCRSPNLLSFKAPRVEGNSGITMKTIYQDSNSKRWAESEALLIAVEIKEHPVDFWIASKLSEEITGVSQYR